MKSAMDKDNAYYAEAYQLKQTLKLKEKRILELEDINAVLRSKIISLERKLKQVEGAEG